jgi:type III secretion protein L
MSANIVKGNSLDALRLSSGATIKKDVYDAQLQAHQIVDDAQREAQRLVKEAQEQSAGIVEAAHQEGYAAGLTEWNEILIRARRAYDDAVSQNEPQLVRLAVKIAEKVIGEELRIDPDTIVKIVREALRSARRDRSVLVEVNPEHEAALRSRIEFLRSSLGGEQEIRIVPNPAIPPGGCVVQSEIGIIDAKLETQLRCMEQALLGSTR